MITSRIRWQNSSYHDQDRAYHKEIGRCSFIVISICYFLAFTPFFSPIPLATDVQPIFLLPIALLLLDREMQRFTRIELVFLFLAVFSILYINTIEPYFSFRQSFGLLVAFAAYHFFRVYLSFISPALLFTIVLINFFAVAFHFIAPQLFAESLGQFVRTIKILSMDGQRGASGFAAEPGFIGGLSVFYLSVATYLKEFTGEDRYYWPILVVCVCIVVLSRSGTGGMLLLIFSALLLFKLKFTYLIASVIVVYVLYLVSSVSDLGRAGFAIRMIFDDPRYLFLVDSSVGQRIINIAVGLLSVYEYPFGAGAGSFNRVADELIQKYGLFNIIQGNAGNISAFAKYSVELGLMFWSFLVYLVYKAFSCVGSRAAKYVFVALFFISGSFSIVFPPIWFIFASLHRLKGYRSIVEN